MWEIRNQKFLCNYFKQVLFLYFIHEYIRILTNKNDGYEKSKCEQDFYLTLR